MEKKLVYKSQKAKELKKKVNKAASVSADTENQLNKVRNALSDMEFGGKAALTEALRTLEKRLRKQKEKGQIIDWGFEAAEELYGNADRNSAGKRASVKQTAAGGAIAGTTMMAFGPITGLLVLYAITKIGTGEKKTPKEQTKNGTEIEKIKKEKEQVDARLEAELHDPSNYYYNCGKKYNRAENLITYNPDEWPSDYETCGYTGCTAAAFATAISALIGKKFTPLEYSVMNGQYPGHNNLRYIEPQAITALREQYGVLTNELSPTTAELDAALERYHQNPLKYSAPIIYVTTGTTHAVVVTEKLADGKYTTIDSGIYYDKSDTERKGASTYDYSPTSGGWSTPKGLWGPLTYLTQMEKMEQKN